MVILRDINGDGGGGDNGRRQERITLEVICPSKDFSNSGGIKDGIDALNLLNATYERTRTNLQRGFSIGGSSSGNVSSSGEIRLNISGSAIQASLIPGQKVRLNLAAKDFDLTWAGNPPVRSLGGHSVPPGVRAPASRKPAAETIRQDFELRHTAALNELGTAYSTLVGSPEQVRRGKLAAKMEYHSSVQAAAGRAASAAGGAGLNNLQASYMTKQAQSYKAAESAAAGLRFETDRLNESTRSAGRNMVQNIKHATTWAASAGVLYGALSLVRRSLEENIEIGRQMSILSVVFKGGSEAVNELTTGVMALATANGQSSREAVESATEWSRIFHTKKEVLDATNASMVLANTSGKEAAETTSFLSMMVQVYKLRASELNAVIGEMVSISQNANVTQQDLMNGMEAAGEAAKEAGMSYSKTFGLIAGGVSATKQSGTSIGNTLKTMITQMSNPDIQNRLRFGSGIEVTQGGAGLREMPEILNQIYIAYQRMSRAERESLLFNIGGRQNATRLAGILDQYIAGQTEAINSQLNLNRAQLENSRILDTLKGQTKALVAEWDRFVLIQGQGSFGPMQALTDVSKALKEILQIADAPGIQTVVKVIGALGVGMGARLVVSGLRSSAAASAEGGVKGGIVVSTIRSLRNDAAAFGNVFGETAQVGALRLNQALMLIPGATARIAPGMYEMGAATRFAMVGFAGLTDVLLPLLAVWGAVKAINYLAEGGRSTADSISEASRAKAAMSAHADRADLIGTASAALGDVRTPAARRMEIAKQIASAQKPFGTPAEISQLEKQNQLLIEQGRLSELLEQLDKSRAEALQDSTRERLNGKNAIQQQIMLEQQHLNLIAKFEQTKRLSSGRGKMLFEGEFTPLAADYIHGFDATVQEAKKHILELRDQLKDFDEETRRLADDTYTRSEIRTGVIGASQSLALQGIGAQYGMLGTASPLDEYSRKIAQLTTQQGYLNQAKAALDVPGAFGLSPEQLFKARQSTMQEYSKNASDLGALQKPWARRMAEDQTRLGVYNRMSRAEWQSFARAPGRDEIGEFPRLTPGWTEGEQLVNQSILGKGRLQELRYETQTRQGSDGETRQRNAEILQIEIGLMENKMTAQLKIIELTKEEINLNAQARREYERGLLTSSPSELLRKAATMRLAHGRGVGEPGGMSAGEFFAFSQEARGDLLRMPGNTQGETDARRARTALERHFGRVSPFDLGEQAVNGAISASRYGSLVQTPSPLLNISEGAMSALMELGNVSAVASQQIAILARQVATLGAAIDAVGGNGGHHGPPVIAQSVPNWTQR